MKTDYVLRCCIGTLMLGVAPKPGFGLILGIMGVMLILVAFIDRWIDNRS